MRPHRALSGGGSQSRSHSRRHWAAVSVLGTRADHTGPGRSKRPIEGGRPREWAPYVARRRTGVFRIMKRFLAVERALRTTAPHELLDAIRAVLIEQYGAEDVELFMADSSLSVLQPASVLPRTLEPVSVHNSPPGRAFGSQQPYREEGRNGQTVCATTGSACCRSRCPTATPLTAQPTGRGRTYVHALRQSGEIEPRFRLQDPKSPQLVRRQPQTRPPGQPPTTRSRDRPRHRRSPARRRVGHHPVRSTGRPPSHWDESHTHRFQ